MTKFDKALDYALEQTANWEHRDHIKRIGFMEVVQEGQRMRIVI